jgi:hypothetical protein
MEELLRLLYIIAESVLEMLLETVLVGDRLR